METAGITYLAMFYPKVRERKKSNISNGVDDENNNDNNNQWGL